VGKGGGDKRGRRKEGKGKERKGKVDRDYLPVPLSEILNTPMIFRSSVGIQRWAYVRYCRSVMAQKLFLTGPGVFKRAER